MKTHHLEKVCEQYLSKRDIAPSTLKAYNIAFKKYIDYLKEHNIVYAKTSDVLRYREHRRELGYSSHYIYIHISALKGLYRYLQVNSEELKLPKVYQYDIMAHIKNERISPRITKPVLTVKEAKHLIQHTLQNRKYIWHYRDHAIIYLMITSGLRSSEIVHAKRKNYQLVDGTQLLYIKRKEEDLVDEFVKIAPGVKKAIDRYLEKRNDDNPYLFISHRKTSKEGHLSRTFFKDMFARVLKECKLEDKGITPHCLRHTAAMFNLLRGGTIEQTKLLLRHQNIQSTVIYQDHIKRMQDDSEQQIEAFILHDAFFTYNNDTLFIDLNALLR